MKYLCGKYQYNWLVFCFFGSFWGMKTGNAANQREHLILVIANMLIRKKESDHTEVAWSFLISALNYQVDSFPKIRILVVKCKEYLLEAKTEHVESMERDRRWKGTWFCTKVRTSNIAAAQMKHLWLSQPQR